MPLDTATQRRLAADLGRRLVARGFRLATAESCTGGLIAGVITSIAGSSDWFERGFVTYSNEAKQEMLGVPRELIETHGAVSEATAKAMAEGALVHSRADCAVAVTGIAGPGGGTPTKPVGMVCFGWAAPGVAARVATRHFPGGRAQVRAAAVRTALIALIDLVDDLPAAPAADRPAR